MQLEEAKKILKDAGYLLETKYNYKLTLTFYTDKAADDFYWKNNEDYVCTNSSIGYVLFFWFNENNEVKQFINELIDNDKVEKFELKKN